MRRGRYRTRQQMVCLFQVVCFSLLQDGIGVLIVASGVTATIAMESCRHGALEALISLSTTSKNAKFAVDALEKLLNYRTAAAHLDLFCSFATECHRSTPEHPHQSHFPRPLRK